LVDIKPSALNSTVNVECDGLLIDEDSVSNAVPDIRVGNAESVVAHEASAGKISEEELFYLQSKGIGEEEAMGMIVNGFVSPIMKELPLEYASEMNVLISMEMEGGI
jgi:Fe-S cluster assembly protein SufB